MSEFLVSPVFGHFSACELHVIVLAVPIGNDRRAFPAVHDPLLSKPVPPLLAALDRQDSTFPEKMEREFELDSLQKDVFVLITKLMNAGGPLGAKALLRLMFAESDLIVIDQKTKVRQTQIEWYPLAMGYGLENPDTQIDWVSPLVNSRQHTYTSEQFYYQNGAVFNVNCNLRGILKPGHIDYTTLSLVQIPQTRWGSEYSKGRRTEF